MQRTTGKGPPGRSLKPFFPPLFPDIAAGVTLPKPRQDFVAYRTRFPPEFVNADRATQDFDVIAALRCAIRQIGHIDNAQVHRQPPDERAAAVGDDGFDAGASDSGAAARQTVGIADRQSCETAYPRRRPFTAIADPLAGR